MTEVRIIKDELSRIKYCLIDGEMCMFNPCCSVKKKNNKKCAFYNLDYLILKGKENVKK